jgi:lysophospholipase L1-like esterase
MFNKLGIIAFLALALAGCGTGLKASSDVKSSHLNSNIPVLKMAALGDSISRGFDITAIAQDDLSDNWTTGTGLPNSVANRLSAAVAPNYQVAVNNYAISGETVLGSASLFASQAGLVSSHGNDVVTVEIGANDVCNGLVAGTGATALRDHMISVLNLLVSSPHPPTVIALVSIPHIYSLTQIPALSSSAICQAAWQLLCPNLQIGQSAFEAQWMAANQALQDAAALVGGPVIYDGGTISATNFALADVSSIDCFHPSVAGQAKIAGAIWPLIQSAVNSDFGPSSLAH